MAYTNQQLTEVRQAIVDLGTGARVTRISQNGRTVEFGEVDLPKLRALEREIASALQLQSAKQRTRTRQVITAKGL